VPRLARLIALVLALASLSGLSLAAASTSAAPRLAAVGGALRTAVTDPELFLGSDRDAAFAHVAATGASYVRIVMNWRDVAPPGSKQPAGFDATNPDDPAYHWATVDAAVQSAVAHGLTPIVTIADAPLWAQRGHPGVAPYDPVPADFGIFVKAAVEHYDGAHGPPRIMYWQAWNEPNVNIFLAPQFARGQPYSPVAYRALLNAFSTAVHSVAPSDIVVAGALSPFTVRSGATVTVGPLRFMRSMLCMSAGATPKPTCSATSSFDVWAIHPYTSGNAFHKASNPDDASLGDLPRVRALLAAAIKAGHVRSTRSSIRTWVTEFSWDTNPPDPHGVPITTQARWTSEALWQCWRNGIDLVTWWTLRDQPYPSSPLQSGLYFRGSSIGQDRPKPTLTAFRFPFVAFPRGNSVYVWGRTPDSRPHDVTIEAKAGTSWVPFAHVRANSTGIFRATLGRQWVGTFLRARSGSDLSLAFSRIEPPDLAVHPFG
jgi:hypothetical protein